MIHLKRYHSRRFETADHNHATAKCGKVVKFDQVKFRITPKMKEQEICPDCLNIGRIKNDKPRFRKKPVSFSGK